MNPAPNASSEQEPTVPEKASQSAEQAPPSITSSIDELGKRLEAKNEADETAPLATEEPA